MEQHQESLNHFLVNCFNEILKTEEYCLSSSGYNLSLREMHTVEAVCDAEDRGQDNRATAIAAALRVTAGTLTTAVTLLEKKGYLRRKRDEKDRRIVRIHSTRLGRAANERHAQFHREMVEDILAILTPEETEILARALKGIGDFFNSKYSGGTA